MAVCMNSSFFFAVLVFGGVMLLQATCAHFPFFWCVMRGAPGVVGSEWG